MKKDIDLIKEIRERLGISLREAQDFWMTDPENAKARLETAVEKMKASNQPYVSDIEKVRNVILDYYKEPTTVNQVKSFKIEELLGMSLASHRNFQEAFK